MVICFHPKQPSPSERQRLVERKARLKELLAQLQKGGRVLYLSDLPADADWFRLAVIQMRG